MNIRDLLNVISDKARELSSQAIIASSHNDPRASSYEAQGDILCKLLKGFAFANPQSVRGAFDSIEPRTIDYSKLYALITEIGGRHQTTLFVDKASALVAQLAFDNENATAIEWHDIASYVLPVDVSAMRNAASTVCGPTIAYVFGYEVEGRYSIALFENEQDAAGESEWFLEEYADYVGDGELDDCFFFQNAVLLP